MSYDIIKIQGSEFRFSGCSKPQENGSIHDFDKYFENEVSRRDEFITEKTNGLSVLKMDEIVIHYPQGFCYGLPLESMYCRSTNNFVNCLQHLQENNKLDELDIKHLFIEKNMYVCNRTVSDLFKHGEHKGRIILPIYKYGYSNSVYAVVPLEKLLNANLKELDFLPDWLEAYKTIIPEFF